MQNGTGEKQSELKYQVSEHRPNSINILILLFNEWYQNLSVWTLRLQEYGFVGKKKH